VYWRLRCGAAGAEVLCERLLPIGKERIAWSKMAAVWAAARFCEPSSELHIAEDWYRRTALSDLLRSVTRRSTRIGSIAARSPARLQERARSASVAALRRAICDQNEVLLYDVTSTYFEARAQPSAGANAGYSRDHRPD